MGKISQHRTFVLEYIKNFFKSKQATRVETYLCGKQSSRIGMALGSVPSTNSKRGRKNNENGGGK